ncbi:hypothetical protein B5V89_19730 [Heyndrickxia sporothermodurans]|nr:hypothetical protein B5V89_19730 [Heyndrickxia sporothermodurans]
MKKLDFLNRDQLSKIHRLGKVRNTNRILNALSPYLSNFREEYSTIYYLNSQGREYVNSQKIRRKNQFVNHIIMRNDFYIFSKCPAVWTNEVRIKDNHHSVICDALFQIDKRYYFLEVDSTQKMKANRAKIQQYLGLFKGGAIKEHFGHFPGLIWLTRTELRRKQLIELCKGLPCKVYTINEIR